MKMKSLLLVLATILGWTGAAAAAVRAGTVSELAGAVAIVRAESTQRDQARVGVIVNVGDTVETSANGKAKLLLGDDSVITISPNSRFRISRALYDPAKKSRDSSFTLLAGKVRSLVSKFWGSAGANFEVRTPTAVAGVRGTEFVQEINADGSSTITVLEGKVEVYNPKDSKKRAVVLTQGQRTSVKEGKTPAAPQSVPTSELEQLDQESEINSEESETTGGDDNPSDSGDDDTDSGSGGDQGQGGDDSGDEDSGQTQDDGNSGGDSNLNDPSNSGSNNIDIPKTNDLLNQQVDQAPTRTRAKIKVDF